jgi:homocysteine S-methyltransferase
MNGTPRDFRSVITSQSLLLTEGSVIENLRRDRLVRLDPDVANAGLIYDDAGRAALTDLYRRYVAVSIESRLAMLIETPTWRANPERLRAAGLGDRDVNGDCFRFLDRLRTGHTFIAGLMGPARDAYDPAQALTESDAESFHREQAQALARAGVDVLLAATLPTLSEAVGIARAMAGTGRNYILSFVLLPEGTLLDAAPLAEAISRIDATVRPAPLCYMANCVHPDRFEAALATCPAAARRLIGLQANTSRLTPAELDGLGRLDAEAPEPFAAAMLRVHERYGTRILGGCCGTGPEHIAAIAGLYRARSEALKDEADGPGPEARRR